MAPWKNPSSFPAIAVGVIALSALGLHAWSFLPFMPDDAFISLRYARRLLSGHGLTWTDGPPVEGYSNLLWILLCAGVGLAGVDLITAARALGFVGMGSAVCALVWMHRPRHAADALPALAGSLAVGLCGPIAAWTIGGMEQPLLAGLLAWAIILSLPLLERDDLSFGRVLLPGLLLGLTCITRPDGVVFAATLCAAMLLAKGTGGRSLRLAAILALLPVACCLGQLVFRRAYYGEWWPNTAYVKFSPSPNRLSEGLSYLRGGAYTLGPLILLAATGVAAGASGSFYRKRALLLVAPICGWAVYLAVIGGDIFNARRHLVPVIVLLAMLAAQGLHWLRASAGPRERFGVWLGTVFLLGLLGYTQSNDMENREARAERWEWDGEVAGKLFKNAFGGQQALLAVDSAGCLPYWSELPAIDMLGLNDRHIARHRPLDFGEGYLGHELGDGAYLLARSPDLVVFCGPGGPKDRTEACYRSGREMHGTPEFHRRYTPVVLEGTDPHLFRVFVWVLRESRKIGIQRWPARIAVPGFLLNGNDLSIAGLDSQGRLGMRCTPRVPAGLKNFALPPGRWDAAVAAPEGRVRIAVKRAGDERVLADGLSPVAFSIDGGRAVPIDLVIAPADRESVHARELIFTRLEEIARPNGPTLSGQANSPVGRGSGTGWPGS